MRNKLLSAQSITEYVIFLGLIVAGFTGFQIFIQRSLQANVKVSADILGEQKDWEQNDWRKGGSAYLATADSYPLTHEADERTLHENGSVEIVKGAASGIVTGEMEANAMSEGF